MAQRKKITPAGSEASAVTEADREGQRGADVDREKAVYEYLLSLTDLGTAAGRRGQDKLTKPNESSVAKQWGMERIFVRRVLRSVLHEKYYANEDETPVPGLTLGKLVKILSSLQSYWNGQRSAETHQRVPRILTYAENCLWQSGRVLICRPIQGKHCCNDCGKRRSTR
jgi:hypothetical protein